MVVCLLYIWVYFTQTVGGCQPLRAFILRKNHLTFYVTEYTENA